MTTKILLVDDEPLLLSSLQRLLRRRGFEVFVAGSTFEALDVIRSEPIDVVLTDYAMPGPDGLELLVGLRDHHPEIACVLVTAAMDIDRRIERAVAAAGGLLLLKPWASDDLDVVIEAALARSRRRHRAVRKARRAAASADPSS